MIIFDESHSKVSFKAGMVASAAIFPTQSMLCGTTCSVSICEKLSGLPFCHCFGSYFCWPRRREFRSFSAVLAATTSTTSFWCLEYCVGTALIRHADSCCKAPIMTYAHRYDLRVVPLTIFGFDHRYWCLTPSVLLRL